MNSSIHSKNLTQADAHLVGLTTNGEPVKHEYDRSAKSAHISPHDASFSASSFTPTPSAAFSSSSSSSLSSPPFARPAVPLSPPNSTPNRRSQRNRIPPFSTRHELLAYLSTRAGPTRGGKQRASRTTPTPPGSLPRRLQQLSSTLQSPTRVIPGEGKGQDQDCIGSVDNVTEITQDNSTNEHKRSAANYLDDQNASAPTYAESSFSSSSSVSFPSPHPSSYSFSSSSACCPSCFSFSRCSCSSSVAQSTPVTYASTVSAGSSCEPGPPRSAATLSPRHSSLQAAQTSARSSPSSHNYTRSLKAASECTVAAAAARPPKPDVASIPASPTSQVAETVSDQTRNATVEPSPSLTPISTPSYVEKTPATSPNYLPAFSSSQSSARFAASSSSAPTSLSATSYDSSADASSFGVSNSAPSLASFTLKPANDEEKNSSFSNPRELPLSFNAFASSPPSSALSGCSISLSSSWSSSAAYCSTLPSPPCSSFPSFSSASSPIVSRACSASSCSPPLPAGHTRTKSGSALVALARGLPPPSRLFVEAEARKPPHNWTKDFDGVGVTVGSAATWSGDTSLQILRANSTSSSVASRSVPPAEERNRKTKAIRTHAENETLTEGGRMLGSPASRSEVQSKLSAFNSCLCPPWSAGASPSYDALSCSAPVAVLSSATTLAITEFIDQLTHLGRGSGAALSSLYDQLSVPMNPIETKAEDDPQLDKQELFRAIEEHKMDPTLPRRRQETGSHFHEVLLNGVAVCSGLEARVSAVVACGAIGPCPSLRRLRDLAQGLHLATEAKLLRCCDRLETLPRLPPPAAPTPGRGARSTLPRQQPPQAKCLKLPR
eukprot:GHVT01022459.1.p1 GENE.GHVT01022459.1~~GHVT01022459.1.p1  ORF type:complete len:836 (+),score=144.05 GHVT01022459.1:332-2839(+)